MILQLLTRIRRAGRSPLWGWIVVLACLHPVLLGAAARDNFRPLPRANVPPAPAPKKAEPVVTPPPPAAPVLTPASTAVAAPAAAVPAPAPSAATVQTPPPAPPPPSLLPPNPAAPLKPAAPVAPRGDVEISSDGGFEYDGETGRVFYRNKVKVLDPANDPKTIITAEWLTTVLPPAGGKVGEIIAITNVVIKIIDPKGEQVARGSKAVYNATNDIITLTGDPPILELPAGILYGDGHVVFNRITGQFQAPGRIRMVARQGASAPLFGVGSTSGSKTNAPPAPAVPANRNP